MSEFTNVTVIKKANVYFDGKVVSRTVVFADGSKKTLGIRQPGEYQFNTGDRELMEIISGKLAVALDVVQASKRLQRERLSKFRRMPNFTWWSER
jgi:purine/pyrimidine-nucleoside phosphorylase